MATNVIDQWGRGIAQGLSLGQQMLRQQELRSQQALRQLQERQIAQEMALELEQHQMGIQRMADVAKANVRFNTFSQFTPDKGAAFMQAYGPLAQTPAEAGKVMLDAATINLREAQVRDEAATTAARNQPRPLTPEDQALKEAQTDLTRARIKQVEQGSTYAPTDTQKNLKALAEAELSNDANAIAALRRQLKLDGLTETEMVKFRSELRALDNDILMDAGEKEQRRQRIYQKYDKTSAAQPEVAPAQPAPVDDEVIIMIDPNGKRYKVPRSKRQQFIERFQMKEIGNNAEG